MSISTYPNGFADGLIVRGMPVLQSNPGVTYWVSNSSVIPPGSSAGRDQAGKTSYQRPLATVAYALTRCVAGQGDIIFVMPGHAETISSATALGLSVAGVTIIGLGSGSSRPTFTLDTAATSTIAVSAANIALSNLIFTANFADITSVFTLTTAKDFYVEKCLFKATATNMNFLNLVDTNATSNDADGLTMVDNVWIEPDTATLQMVKMDGTNARINISGNDLTLGVRNNTPALMAIATTKIVTASKFSQNTVYRLNTDSATGGLLITTDQSTNTGIVSHNHVQHADTASEILVTASSGFGFIDNRASGVAGASGYLLPAADA